MNESRPLVSVVDDDESVRESLPDLLREFGFAVETFASAEEFLASGRMSETRCLILDVAMPGMTGPDLQRELVHAAAADSDHLHHGSRRPGDPAAPHRAGGRRLPAQAVQRYGPARGARRRTWGALGDPLASPEYRTIVWREMCRPEVIVRGAPNSHRFRRRR